MSSRERTEDMDDSALLLDILTQARGRPIVYIAGPMRGIEEFNFPAFDEARDYLDGMDSYYVVSPADLDRRRGLDLPDPNVVGEVVFQGCMKLDLAIVAQASAIFLLEGWENSRGCTNELFVANAAGIEIWQPSRDPVSGHIIGDFRSSDSPVPTVEQYETTILEEANGLIYGPRQDMYGHPVDDFTRTGRMWGAILGTPDVPPERVGLCMVAVKISREVNRPKRDNRVDMAGYAGCVDRIADKLDLDQ